MVAPSFKETPKPSTRAKEKMVLLAKPTNEMLSSMKFFESQCQIPANEKPEWLLQFSRLGQIVSLPNPSTKVGFQLKPSFAHRALLPNSIFQMNSQ
jgi:hypothetical protein